jgi:hypothetical protein
VKPLTSQLAHRGFCSSHFRRLFRQVRQPVLTLCLPAGVGFRGIMLDYSVHNPRRGKWKKQNGRSVASIPPEQCSDLLRRAPSKTCKGESIQPGKWGGPKKAGQFDQKMRLAPLRVGFFFSFPHHRAGVVKVGRHPRSSHDRPSMLDSMYEVRIGLFDAMGFESGGSCVDLVTRAHSLQTTAIVRWHDCSYAHFYQLLQKYIRVCMNYYLHSSRYCIKT